MDRGVIDVFVGARNSTSTRQTALTLREAVSTHAARFDRWWPDRLRTTLSRDVLSSDALRRLDVRGRLERLDRRRAAGAAAGVLVLGGAGVGVLLYAPMVRVSHVVVEGPAVAGGAPAQTSQGVASTGGLGSAEQQAITAAAGISMGEPLVKVDTEAVAERVAGLGRYRKVEASRAWPDGVRIDVLPRIPVVAVASSQGPVQLVDEGGVAYDGAAQAPPQVPVARLQGVRDAAQRQAAVAAVAALDVQRRAQVTGLEVSSSGQVQMSLGEVEVKWGGADDAALKAAVVAALVDRAGIRTLDVRAPQRPVTTG